MAEVIKQIFEELNYPGAAILKKALRNRGIQFDSKQVDDIVAQSVSRQVQAPKYGFTGKIASSTLNARFFC